MELTALDDRDLIRQAQAGDKEAFRTLVERYMRKVYAVAFDMTGNHHDAEDVSQDVFLRAFQTLDRYRGEAGISTWLYRTAVNACIDRGRKRARWMRRRRDAAGDRCEKRSPADDEGHLSQPESATEAFLLQQRIGKALDALPQRQRAVFALRHYHGLPFGEIAQCLQITEGTVKSTLFKATRKLRTKLNRSRP